MPESTSPLPRRTFIELYCEQTGADAGKFESKVLRQSLYPHARLIAPLLRIFSTAHFAADLDFVRSVAHVRRSRDFFNEADAFAHHPANVGILRHVLRLRVSSTRLHRLVRATLHPHASGTDSAEGKTHPALRAF